MTTVYDVPADLLIAKLAKYLKEKVKEVSPPPWAKFVKTGVHKERPPQDPDWWYVRCASILRKLYLKGPIGVERCRKFYGGRKDRGHAPEHTYKGSGAIIRKAFQQLEAAGLVEKVKKEIKGKEVIVGRGLTRKGRSLLDSLAHEVAKEILAKNPNHPLKKYV